MPRHYLLSILLALAAAVFSSPNIAGPVVKICLELECKHPGQIEISDATWAIVKDLHAAPLQTDKDEQDNIINSISLIEKDIFTSLAEFTSNNKNVKNLAREIYKDIGIDNKYRNLKNILAPLLDNHMITRHVLRNKITLKSWAGIEKQALLIQSLNNSQLYTVEYINSNLGSTVAIMPYKDKPTIENNTIIKQTGNRK